MQSCITLSKSALLHNLSEIRTYLGDRKKIISVVKANGYGHGMEQVVSVIEKHTDAFAIDDVQELIQLRKLTNKDIYILGHVCKEDIEEILINKGISVVYDKTMLEIINQTAATRNEVAEINIKLDAFLGRQGILMEELPVLLKRLSQLRNVKLRGIYTHFSNIEDTKDVTHAQRQIDQFKKACLLLKEQGYSLIEKHISSTAGILIYDQAEALCTHVRLGIGLYGLWPSEDLKSQYQSSISLKPVLSWKSCIAQVKEVPAHFPIGYGCTYITKEPTTIAVVPQGYSDGYDRGMSNKGEMLVRGKRCPVLGRVAMNMCVIDVSGIEDVRVEDEVILIGSQGNENISADQVAARSDTISYEVVARISPYIQRELGE